MWNYITVELSGGVCGIMRDSLYYHSVQTVIIQQKNHAGAQIRTPTERAGRLFSETHDRRGQSERHSK